jgi:hypothetical protein
MTTHTADCAECDFRLAKVPAQDWPPGSQRPIYLFASACESGCWKCTGSAWGGVGSGALQVSCVETEDLSECPVMRDYCVVRAVWARRLTVTPLVCAVAPAGAVMQTHEEVRGWVC